jgi:hypothetical protein
MRLRMARAQREGAVTPLLRLPIQPGRSVRVTPVFLATIGAWALWPVLASAQVAATSDYLARMDSDRDGRVSLAEYQAWMGYAFERMDLNRDGLLTADELPGGKGRTVSLVEHRQSLADMFGRQDADRDGFLSAKELAAPPR